MTLPEQGAKVATSAIDAMRAQPMLLGVLFLNIVIFVVIFYAVQSNRAQQHEVMKLIIDQNAKATEMLSKCIVPRTNARSPVFRPMHYTPLQLPPKEPQK